MAIATAKRLAVMAGMMAVMSTAAVPAFAQETAPQYQYGGGEGGPGPERAATLSFELAVECEPPADATFFGNVQTGEGGPGIFAQLLDPDGDGLYTGVATLPDRFGPGPNPVPPSVEPVSLPVSVVQGTGTRSAGSGTLPGEPTSVIRDFGVVPMEAENAFSASVSFCDDDGGNGAPVVSGDTNDDTGGSGQGSSGQGGSGQGGSEGAAGAANPDGLLPATGGLLPVGGAIGALLLAGGLIARRIAR